MENLPKIPNMLVALIIALIPGLVLWFSGAFPDSVYWWSAGVVVLLNGLLRWFQQYAASNMALLDPSSRPSTGAKVANVIWGRG